MQFANVILIYAIKVFKILISYLLTASTDIMRSPAIGISFTILLTGLCISEHFQYSELYNHTNIPSRVLLHNISGMKYEPTLLCRGTSIPIQYEHVSVQPRVPFITEQHEAQLFWGCGRRYKISKTWLIFLGLLFTKQTDVLPQDLVKSRSCEIRV